MMKKQSRQGRSVKSVAEAKRLGSGFTVVRRREEPVVLGNDSVKRGVEKAKEGVRIGRRKRTGEKLPGRELRFQKRSISPVPIAVFRVCGALYCLSEIIRGAQTLTFVHYLVLTRYAAKVTSRLLG